MRAIPTMLIAAALAAGAHAADSPEPADAGPDPAASLSAGWHALHAVYFRRNWGVDIVGVRLVASGSMLEFRYRVLDPDKASALSDARSPPTLIDRRSGAHLQVPSMENIGALRQASSPKADRVYWMVFGNPGRLVQPGGQVDVVIGDFRADGLAVQ
jgi:hypothetical protein